MKSRIESYGPHSNLFTFLLYAIGWHLSPPNMPVGFFSEINNDALFVSASTYNRQIWIKYLINGSWYFLRERFSFHHRMNYNCQTWISPPWACTKRYSSFFNLRKRIFFLNHPNFFIYFSNWNVSSLIYMIPSHLLINFSLPNACIKNFIF